MAPFHMEQIGSVQGKIIIVTGANSGIGLAIAKILSSKDAKVILACRNESKGLETQRLIGGDSTYVSLDLACFSSICRFAEYIKATYPKIDILINNAGVMFPPFSKTNDDLELTFGVNYMGYYFLTNKLISVMKNVEDSRVVNMSSVSHYNISQINWNNINSELYYNKIEVYKLSNLFRIMFTIELEKKLRERRYETISVACHPGVTLTNISRFMPKLFSNSILATVLNRWVFHSPADAAMPAVMATAHTGIEGGQFVGLDTNKQFKGKPKIVLANELVYNKWLREKLWKESVKITGLDLE